MDRQWLTVDCLGKTSPAVNQEIREALARGHDRFLLIHPRGLHNLGAGLVAPARYRVDGNVGHYCLGLSDHAEADISGHAGWGLGENMMGGEIILAGNAGASAGASMRGGSLVIRGDAGARAGIAMKGGLLLVGGNAGYMTGFMMQKGIMIVLGDVGPALGDSMYDGTIYVGGAIRALGNDAVEAGMTAEDEALVGELMERYRMPSPAAFRKIVSGGALHNFDAKELSVWKNAL